MLEPTDREILDDQHARGSTMVAATSFFIPLSAYPSYRCTYEGFFYSRTDTFWRTHPCCTHTCTRNSLKVKFESPSPPVRSRQRPAAPRPSRLPRHREGGQPRGEPGRRHRLPGVCREDPPQERNHGQSRQYEKIINFFSSRVVGVLLAPSPHGPMGSKVPTAGLCTRNGASFVLP